MLRFICSTNHAGKGHESQICLSIIMDYTLVPSTKSEGICTENLRHVIINSKGLIKRELGVYFLIR